MANPPIAFVTYSSRDPAIVLGLRNGEGDLFIYRVNYNPKMIEARAQRAGEDALYIINPAFCPALNIEPTA